MHLSALHLQIIFLIGAIPLCSSKYMYFTVQNTTYVYQHIDEISITSGLHSEVCHPRCVFKLYGGVNSVKNTTINMWLNDGV